MADQPTDRLSFGLHCSICGDDLIFLGAGQGTPGVMERARCWCAECGRGFVLTVTMRAMNPSEEEVERGRLPASAAPRLGPPVELAPASNARRAQRSRVPVRLPEGVEHGTRAAYERHECRCDPCTDYQRDARAERRNRDAEAEERRRAS